jgi:hypothetical protein
VEAIAVLAFARVDCSADCGSDERARNRAGCAESRRRWDDWTGRMRRTAGSHSVSAASPQCRSEHSPASCGCARVAFVVLWPSAPSGTR